MTIYHHKEKNSQNISFPNNSHISQITKKKNRIKKIKIKNYIIYYELKRFYENLNSLRKHTHVIYRCFV